MMGKTAAAAHGEGTRRREAGARCVASTGRKDTGTGMNEDGSGIDTATPPPEERRRLLRERVNIPAERLAALCERYGVRRLAFFGSVLRHDFRPESDLDVLVEYRPGARTGFRFFELEEELAALLGHRVDLNTLGFLHPRFRDEVLAEAEEVYDAA